MVNWDVRYNTPVLPGNQIVNPHTGVIEAVSSEGIITGPPGIDLFVHNITQPPLGQTCFRGLRATLVLILDKVLPAIGKHIENGEDQVMSLNATNTRSF